MGEDKPGELPGGGAGDSAITPSDSADPPRGSVSYEHIYLCSSDTLLSESRPRERKVCLGACPRHPELPTPGRAAPQRNGLSTRGCPPEPAAQCGGKGSNGEPENCELWRPRGALLSYEALLVAGAEGLPPPQRVPTPPPAGQARTQAAHLGPEHLLGLLPGQAGSVGQAEVRPANP